MSAHSSHNRSIRSGLRGLAILVVPFAAVGMAIIGPAGAAHAATADSVVNGASAHLCLDAAAQSDMNAGGKVQVWKCVGDSNQQWVWDQGKQLVNQAHGLCLDAAAQTNDDNGGTVQVWPCLNSDVNQEWSVRSTGGGDVLVNQAHGLCLDANAQTDSTNGGKVQVWSCVGDSNQHWTIPTTNQYPYLFEAGSVCNHLFRIISPTVAYDPTSDIDVGRGYTFGWWDGHCVYKLSDSVGIDVNSRQVVVAETTSHWDVFAAAGEQANTCFDDTGDDVPTPVDAVIVSWCGVYGAASSVFG